jgi:tetratricopeptide (TPR) repeat protein
MGNAYLELNNFPHAIASYRQAVDIDPNLSPALAHMGITYFKDKNPDEAIKWLRRALAVEPRSTDALNAMESVEGAEPGPRSHVVLPLSARNQSQFS